MKADKRIRTGLGQHGVKRLRRTSGFYLTVQQADEGFHLLDHLHQFGQRRVVVLLGNPVQPLEVVHVLLQVGVQLGQGLLQLGGAREVRVSHSRGDVLGGRRAAHVTGSDVTGVITSRLLRSEADLLLISGRDMNLWGSTSESKVCSL